ncbi:aldehyde dehydrogenase, partial [Pseudoalteromonas sp. S1610]
KDEAEGLELANSSEFGLGAAGWSRNMNRAYHFGSKIETGRVWTNRYHMYPAHAAV